MKKKIGLRDDELWFENVQGNILKGHGRDHQCVVLLGWDAPRAEALREVLGVVEVTSFAAQLEQAAAYRANDPTDAFCGVYLSAKAYAALGLEAPTDPAFREGAIAAASRLEDPDPSGWEQAYRDVNVVFLIADDSLAEVESVVDRIRERAEPAAPDVWHVDYEQRRLDEAGRRLEQFGFVDGVSNPVFLERDLARKQRDRFDPHAPPELALVPDPAADGGFGSYVVLRKIEQDVRGFREAERRTAAALGLGDPEDAGALVIGRRRDGTPLAAASPSTDEGPPNDFDFTDDFGGGRCPFHAHIRKANGRGEAVRWGARPDEERWHRLVRRGFTYGERREEEPETGVGLVFIGYQSSLVEQFEDIQRRYFNGEDHPTKDAGRDALVASSPSSTPPTWPGGSRFHFGGFTHLKGAAYLFAPSIEVLRTLTTKPGAEPSTKGASTPRTRALRERLVDRAFSDRAQHWFGADEIPSLLTERPELAEQPVIVRKAEACRRMLEIMSDPEIGRRTGTFWIDDGELIVGAPPMGSVGLGKQFPEYLTDDERRASSLSNRDEPSVFGHTVPNFQRVLDKGLEAIADECAKARGAAPDDEARAFYEAAETTCRAVIEHMNRLADLAEAESKGATPERAAELVEVARVCRAVPAKPASSFHEALQCIWTIHFTQTAFCVFNSLGRLDQLLSPYLERDLAAGVLTQSRAVELIECFLIKGAGRLNLDPTALRGQDQLSYGTGIGTRPIYLDQIASCNNFIQNIVLGGVDRHGRDASNRATHLVLEATGGVALCTPTVNVRLHAGTPPEVHASIDRCLRRGETGLPILFNDDSVVPGMIASGISPEDARDYAIAGCWEPVLNGKGSFIFGMVNMLTVLECALNEGTTLSTDPQFLRGIKQSVRTPPASRLGSYEEVLEAFDRHLRFFADKVALGTCTFFELPSAMTPTPFLSVLLDGCLERGRDQSRGGANYNLVSSIAFALPNAANALANIRRLVFEEGEAALPDLVEAMKWNWGVGAVRGPYATTEEPDTERRARWARLRQRCLALPKYGNGTDVDEIAAWLLERWEAATGAAAELAQVAFTPQQDSPQADRLRRMTNYAGPSFRTSLRPDFELVFTAGSGTFGQYSSMGKGVNASLDGRAAHEPVAPNCSPPGGTARDGLAGIYAALEKQSLSHFGSAVVLDIRIDGTRQPDGFFAALARDWVSAGGSMLTVSVLSTAECLEMLRVTDRVRAGSTDRSELRRWCDRMCRVGGWNSNFINLPRPQQRDHIERALDV